jgi:hypothetical protein
MSIHFAVLFVVTVRHLQFQVKNGDQDATGGTVRLRSGQTKILPAATAKISTCSFRCQATVMNGASNATKSKK